MTLDEKLNIRSVLQVGGDGVELALFAWLNGRAVETEVNSLRSERLAVLRTSTWLGQFCRGSQRTRPTAVQADLIAAADRGVHSVAAEVDIAARDVGDVLRLLFATCGH